MTSTGRLCYAIIPAMTLSHIRSFTSVPDNCALCEQLSSGKLEKKKTYLDMFSWLVREAHCVYTK